MSKDTAAIRLVLEEGTTLFLTPHVSKAGNNCFRVNATAIVEGQKCSLTGFLSPHRKVGERGSSRETITLRAGSSVVSRSGAELPPEFKPGTPLTRSEKKRMVRAEKTAEQATAQTTPALDPAALASIVEAVKASLASK